MFGRVLRDPRHAVVTVAQDLDAQAVVDLRGELVLGCVVLCCVVVCCVVLWCAVILVILCCDVMYRIFIAPMLRIKYFLFDQ